jgi:hypothetical protein
MPHSEVRYHSNTALMLSDYNNLNLNMQLCHTNLKDFDKRVTVESTKVKSLAAGLEKVKKAVEAEKRAYCVDLKKAVDSYGENTQLTPGLAKVIKGYSTGLDNIQKVYDDSTKHIQDVSCNALGYLPTKFETHKKAIKLVEKGSENSIEKLK